MIVGPDTAGVLDAALELVERAAEEGGDFPILRAGVAAGEALAQGGDWYGAPVNLASRITDRARPGSVLASAEVQKELEERYRWSFAGGKRLKGIDGEVKLYRARRAGSRVTPAHLGRRKSAHGPADAVRVRGGRRDGTFALRAAGATGGTRRRRDRRPAAAARRRHRIGARVHVRDRRPRLRDRCARPPRRLPAHAGDRHPARVRDLAAVPRPRRTGSRRSRAGSPPVPRGSAATASAPGSCSGPASASSTRPAPGRSSPA